MAQLKDWLYQVVASVAWFHDWVVRYNRQHSHLFNNSELHFIVIGVFGLLLFLLVYLVFRLLAKHGHVGFMSWLFTLSSVFAVCFAIEVGQHMTNTGRMELEDIVYGVAGFLAASGCVLLLYLLFCLFRWMFRK
ncbi:MAG: hypothetical protein II885_11255 [Oscillospiraceae bacterium]|nr:hypothetical protein [Oscillospiraceae bacterium]